RAHQLAMLRLLVEFDRICRKHNIQYSLFAGTLLGAVRHGGFIPWDDDADVILPRAEYERFLRVAAQELDAESFFLQTEFSPHWPMFFSKLRLNRSACIERYHPRDKQAHRGVYIDIFPCDNLSDDRLIGYLQFAASKAVIARSLCRRGYRTDRFSKKLFIGLCCLLPQKPLCRLVQNRAQCSTAKVHSFFGGGSRYGKNVYPRSWLWETMPVRFENHEFRMTTHYDALLTQLYGDYRTPLPEGERNSKIHAEWVDLQNSYEQYTEWQRHREFHDYTRSIR
ncbi:MAG: LicD family protein, partial [Clostridia bacterium]|nr:LicD family protein [Clostridia bacterium]